MVTKAQEMKILTITPELATEWLNRNPINRSLRPGAVDVLARDIIAEKWELNAV